MTVHILYCTVSAHNRIPPTRQTMHAVIIYGLARRERDNVQGTTAATSRSRARYQTGRRDLERRHNDK